MKTDELLVPHRWAQKYPQFGTGTLPIEPVISKEFFELERDKIFRDEEMVCRHGHLTVTQMVRSWE